MPATDNSDNNDGTAEETYEEKVRREMDEIVEKREHVRKQLIGKHLDDPETMAIAKETVLDLIPDAALQVRYLINHAESETIHKDLSKWILGLGMNERGRIDEEDEMQKLINDLTGGKKTSGE